MCGYFNDGTEGKESNHFLWWKHNKRVSGTANGIWNSSVGMPVYRLKKPADQPLMCDSIRTESIDQRQWYAMNGETNANEHLVGATMIHLRHFKKAEILFCDGHAESCDLTRIRNELNDTNSYSLRATTE